MRVQFNKITSLDPRSSCRSEMTLDDLSGPVIILSHKKAMGLKEKFKLIQKGVPAECHPVQTCSLRTKLTLQL